MKPTQVLSLMKEHMSPVTQNIPSGTVVNLLMTKARGKVLSVTAHGTYMVELLDNHDQDPDTGKNWVVDLLRDDFSVMN